MAYASHNVDMAFMKEMLQLLTTLTVKNLKSATILNPDLIWNTHSREMSNTIIINQYVTYEFKNMQHTQKN